MLYAGDQLSRLETGLRSRLSAWGYGPDAQVRLLTISENATYLVEDPAGRKAVFRVHRPGYHSRAQILSELEWIAALRADGVIDTPAPIPAQDGAFLHGFLDGDDERFVACFEFVAGQSPDADGNTPKWFRVLGAITARMHGQAAQFHLPAGFERKRWNWDTIIGPGAYWGDWRAAHGLGAQDRAILEQTSDKLRDLTQAYGDGADRFGLVHCDMRAANLLVSDDRLFVIDFDDCGFSWFGHDFAAAVSFIEDDPILPELQAAWIAGYESVAPLPPGLPDMLPVFVMLRRMQLTAWLASHAETPTAAALPGYAAQTVVLARAFLARNL